MIKKCEYCGKEFNARTKKQKYCSPKHKIKCRVCGRDFEKETRSLVGETFHVCDNEACKLEKRRRTCLKRYGVESPTQNKEIRAKGKRTLLERYGVEHPCQSNEIKEKTKQTNLKKYGVENVLQSDEIREKIKKTNLEKYGVEHVFQAEEVKEKIKKANLEKYGVEHPMKSEEIKKKIQETNLEKYGTKHFITLPEIQEKRKQAMIEKYGVEYSFSRPEVQETIKRNNMEKYGVERTLQIPEHREKMKQAFIDKYGDDYISELQKFKEEANMKKYGVKSTFSLPEVKEKIKENNFKKYGVSNVSQIHIKHKEEYLNLKETLNKKEKTVREWSEYFGMTLQSFKSVVKKQSLESLIKDFYSYSGPENEFAYLLQANNIDEKLYIRNDREQINPLELDFYFEDFNLAVEVSPSFTHCYIGYLPEDKYTLGLSDKNYHYEKFKACKEKGIELITIFDWTDVDKVLDFIKDKLRVNQNILYARKTVYKEITSLDNEDKDFLSANYILGEVNNKKGTFVGQLWYQETKVGIAVFTSLTEDRVELKRLVFDRNYKIIGGTSKLIKNALKDKGYKELITFSDNDLGTGSVYKKLGFHEVEENKGTLIWYNEKYKKKIPNSSLVKEEADTLLKNFPNYEYVGQGENLPSNQEIVLSYGFLPVYDAGYTKWLKELDYEQ